MSLKDEEKVEVNGVVYHYDAYYERLQLPDFQDGDYNVPAIACPKCHNLDLRLGYGEWECVAYCKCGHSMTVYDG